MTGPTLARAIGDMAEVDTLWLQTDSAGAYQWIAADVADHQTVNHAKGEYVNKTGAGTNLAEGYFSQLKRSLDGTHHHVSTQHLQRYLTQFDFMYSHCRETDSQRLRRMIGNVDGRRLTYKPMIGQA